MVGTSSFINLTLVITNITSGFESIDVYYTNSFNKFNITSDNLKSYYRIGGGLKLEPYSLNTFIIVNVNQLNGITYTKNQVFNTIIERTNTPVTDQLPSNNDFNRG